MANCRCFIDKAKCFFVAVIIAFALLTGYIQSEDTNVLKKLQFNFVLQDKVLEKAEKIFSGLNKMFGKTEKEPLYDTLDGVKAAVRNIGWMAKDALNLNIKALQANVLKSLRSEISILDELIRRALNELPFVQHMDALNVLEDLKSQLNNGKSVKKLSITLTSKLDGPIRQLNSYLMELTGSKMRKEWRDEVEAHFNGNTRELRKDTELDEKRILYYEVYVRLFAFNAMLKAAKVSNEENPEGKISNEHKSAQKLDKEVKLMIELINGSNKVRMRVREALYKGERLTNYELYKVYPGNHYKELDFRAKDADAPKSKALAEGNEKEILIMLNQGPGYLAEGGPVAMMKYELIQDLAALWSVQKDVTVKGLSGLTEEFDTPQFHVQLEAWVRNTVHKNLVTLTKEYYSSKTIGEPSEAYTANQQLNRYPNIESGVPCVENGRVKLQGGHNYIHANSINDPKRERNYICAQGPLKPSKGVGGRPDSTGTEYDFWLMAWQQNVEAIIMLCQFNDGKDSWHRDKCPQYWPVKNQRELAFTSDSLQEKLQVFFVREWELENKIHKTELRIVMEGQQKIVHHFHLLDWPDKGLPVNKRAPLQLIHTLEGYKNVVLHCSAGIGRTGTVATIYLALSTLRAGLPLDLERLLADLRKQRAQSVQTEEQYFYVYYSLLLWYQDMKTENGHKSGGKNMEATNRMLDTIDKKIYVN